MFILSSIGEIQREVLRQSILRTILNFLTDLYLLLSLILFHFAHCGLPQSPTFHPPRLEVYCYLTLQVIYLTFLDPTYYQSLIKESSRRTTESCREIDRLHGENIT
jgi:hypothetical protein